MSVDKNFVVKNGLEVSVDLIFADATNRRVGIASTIPTSSLDVNGNLVVSDGANISGIATITDTLRVGSGGTTLTVENSNGTLGVNTTSSSDFTVDIQRRTGAGATAVNVEGNVIVSGDLLPTNLSVSGIGSIITKAVLAGVSTFDASGVVVSGGVTATTFTGDGSGLTNLTGGYPLITNMLYVAKNGNDSNDGLRLSTAKATVGAALTLADTGTVIKVSAGTYTENNPLKVPEQVSIVGDSLRDVTIRPQNSGSDLFHVKNGDYITDMSFTGIMTDGAAIIAFDPDEPNFINQSPYVRNCTNFVRNSVGMKIDGFDAIGRTKSMVVDSYTQYNENGIGVSITNEGYAQLVSIFTICDDIAIFTGSGGACDLTNSNSSFGNFGLISNGVSGNNFTGIVTVASAADASEFVVDLSVPNLSISNAVYDNKTGLTTITTTTNHDLVVGTAVTLKDLKFSCDSFNTPTFFGISTASYNENTGILSVTTSSNHNFKVGLAVTISDIIFEYDSGGGIAQTTFPPGLSDNLRYVYDVTSVPADNKFVVNVGPSTVAQSYVSGGQAGISTISFFPNGANGFVFTVNSVVGPTTFTTFVGVSTFVHEYDSGGTAESFVVRPFDGQVVYFDELYYTVEGITITDQGSGYTEAPTITIGSGSESWSIDATANASISGGKVTSIDMISNGRGYSVTPPSVTFSAPGSGTTATGVARMLPTYYVISESTPLSSGICTITTTENLPYAVGVGSTAPFYKQSRIIASSHSFEYVGSGVTIATALPQDGGVPIQEKETVSEEGGLVIFTSTDQAGNFRIGDGINMNQQTGTISGRDYSRSLFSTMTPFILALGGD